MQSISSHKSLFSSLFTILQVLDYGGPDGEAGAAMRYLSQRYSMTDRRVMGALTDIGTEELGHLEIVATIIRQLTKNLTPEEIKASGFDKYYIDHTLAIWPQAASGEPFSASQLQSTGDTITDLYEDMAVYATALPMICCFVSMRGNRPPHPLPRIHPSHWLWNREALRLLTSVHFQVRQQCPCFRCCCKHKM